MKHFTLCLLFAAASGIRAGDTPVAPVPPQARQCDAITAWIAGTLKLPAPPP